MRVEVVLMLVAFIALVSGQRIEGIPSQVCGSQNFETTYTTDSSITFQVSSSSADVTVSPNSVTYTSTNSPSIFINCQSFTGAAEIVFSNSDASDSVRFYCAGLITVLNPPKTIRRDSEFELDLTLSPTPVDTVNVIVESLSSLITPGSERVVFGIEQSITNEIFYVPEANIGTAEVIFRSRSLRDYNGPNCEPLSISIDVQGTMSSSLAGGVYGSGKTIEVTLFFDVSATFDQTIFLSTLAVSAPESVILPARATSVTFEVVVTAAAYSEGACVTFTSQYYETITDCFSVVGVFSSDIDIINTSVVESFNLNLVPQVIFGDLVVHVATSPNVFSFSTLNIDNGLSHSEYQVTGLSAGDAWIEFSASGYLTERFDFTIIEVTCDANTEVLSNCGFLCLTCPMTDGVICNNHGTCTTSVFASESARCECDEGFYGPQCEFDSESQFLEFDVFSNSGLMFTTTLIPGAYETTVSIPTGLIQDGANGLGVYYLQAYSRQERFYGSINPYTTEPTPEIAEKTAEANMIGFNFDITAADNTAIHQFIKPVEFYFQFDSRLVSQKQFLQQALYYWQPSSSSWVPAASVCSAQFVLKQKDLLELTYRTNICVSGQYQFFDIVPVPAHSVPKVFVYPDERFVFDDLNEYYISVGFGGVGVEEPPQPSFPIRRDESSTSTSSTLGVPSESTISYSTTTETIKVSINTSSTDDDDESSSSSEFY